MTKISRAQLEELDLQVRVRIESELDQNFLIEAAVVRVRLLRWSIV